MLSTLIHLKQILHDDIAEIPLWNKNCLFTLFANQSSNTVMIVDISIWVVSVWSYRTIWCLVKLVHIIRKLGLKSLLHESPKAIFHISLGVTDRTPQFKAYTVRGMLHIATLEVITVIVVKSRTNPCQFNFMCSASCNIGYSDPKTWN
jgi:hypothetical protein